MTYATRALLAVAASLAAACSAVSDTACERAALAQALAEMHFAEVAAMHDEAHDSQAEHDDGELVSARVEMILATAKAQRTCD